MKSFYGGTYIGKEVLEENNIYYPIRLEYYKIEKEEKPEVERNKVEDITKEEAEIIEILEKFKTGTVMPAFLEETLEGQFQKTKELCIS